MSIIAKDGTILDESVVTLAKAMRIVESGKDFKASGASGEFGAYQYMPKTWSGWAKEYLNDANAEMTPMNQDKVAYYKILSWKQKGYDPKQIASLWNSGSPDWEGKVGTNKHGVQYDVPAHVNKVMTEYKKLQTVLFANRKKEIPEVIPDIEKEEKKKGFLKDMLSSAIALPINYFRIMKAGMMTHLKLGTEEQRNEALLALDKPALGGVVDPLKEGKEGIKQVLGQTLQAAAWVAPVGKIKALEGLATKSPAGAKALEFFGIGFAFSAGDSLEDGDDLQTVIKKGAIGGLASAAFGGVANKIASKVMSSSSAQFKPGSMFNKIKDKYIIKPIGAKGTEQLTKHIHEINQPLWKSFVTATTTTVKKELKDIMSNKLISGLTFGALFSPMKEMAVAVIAGKATLTFLNTFPGRVLIHDIIKASINASIKTSSITDKALQHKIVMPLIAESINEVIVMLNDQFEKDEKLTTDID